MFKCTHPWASLALSAYLLMAAAPGHAGVTYLLTSEAWLYAKASNTSAESNPTASYSHGDLTSYSQDVGNAALSNYYQNLNLSPAAVTSNGYYTADNYHALGAWAGYGGTSGMQHTAYQGYSALEFGAGAQDNVHIEYQMVARHQFSALRDLLGTAANGVPVEFAWATAHYQVFWSALDAGGNWTRENDPLLQLNFFGGFQGSDLSEDIVRYDPEDPNNPGWWWGNYIGDFNRKGPGRIELVSSIEGFVMATYDGNGGGGGCRDTSVPCQVPESGSATLVLAAMAALVGLRRGRRRRPTTQGPGCQA